MRLVLAIIALHAASSLCLFAGQSLRVTSAGGSGYVSFSLPNSAPWTTIGGSPGVSTSQPMRWELRVHDVDAAWNQYAYSVGVGVINQATSSIGFGPQVDTWDSVSRGQGVATVGTDITIRIQRDVANSRYTLEYCSLATRTCTFDPYFSAITKFSDPSFANQLWYIKPGRSVAFIRWYSSVVPLGTPIPLAGAGDIANWDFTNGAVDSVHGLRFSPVGDAAIAYVSTPTYQPLCNAGTVQSFRAGYSGTLDASKSQSLDGSALTYAWQQLAGPSTVSWSSKTVATPTISSIAVGEYQFQLQVATEAGGSASCTVTDSVVASADNGVVSSGNTVTDTLIGPLIRYGASPWPYMDDRHRAAADVRIAYMDTDYPAYWEAENPGTVFVTHGSKTVMGVGTNFLSTVCKSDGTPYDGSTAIVIHYPHADGQGDGYDREYVSSCASNTSLTLVDAYPTYADYPATFPDAVNQKWGDNRGKAFWSYSITPANYYDNVVAFYSLYYRSGLTKYLTAARKLADRFWKCPEVDRGRTPVFSGRSASVLGLLLRSLDSPPADMTAGIHRVWYSIGQYIGNDVNLNRFDYEWGNGELWDVREVGYELNYIAYCAIGDSDATMRTTCQRWLGQAISQLFQPRRRSDGSWGQPYGRLDSSDPDTNSWTAPTSSVILTNSSTTVAGVGTAWQSGDFPAYVWFTTINPTTKPNSWVDGEAVAYRATWNSPTSLTLDRAYEGTTGTHGWTRSVDYIGYGIQPFMEGILSIGFDMAAKALATSDPANSALAAQYHLDTVNWLKNVGYKADILGMKYYVGPNCSSGSSYYPSTCNGGQDYNFEPNRATALAYARTGNTAYRDFSDLMSNNYWAKPGTCPVGSNLCKETASYGATGFDDTGFYMTDPSPGGRGSKWFGGAWGFSASASIP